MNIIEFHKITDKLMFTIQDTLDNHLGNADIDCEIQYYTMTIIFDNKSKIIINRQESLRQIWLATKKNGYHFEYKEKKWICNKSKKNFWDILTQACITESKELIQFKIK
ncbi:iron donor protein CyaY [Buchnera aphidicola (Pemphigus obesinymphae)]|uniref:iron donor protein CyaY n=1 Tax=Buchnera aphidicola TaxID=9 RepID=UPI002238CB4A|nr:iron donor protein CyaY [Buchnera aphidicola]MCW5196730.1 iron donor protein CyaY [Buchnera aphidicola (Pemphigus obesinymphae)]